MYYVQWRQTRCCPCSTCYTTFPAPPRIYVYKHAPHFCPAPNLFSMCTTGFKPRLAPLYTLLQMILHNSNIISSVSIYQIQCCKKSEYLHFTDWAHKEERGEECVFYSIDTNVRRQKKFFSVTESKKFSHHFLNKSGSCNWQSFVIILPWDKVIKVATACGTHWEED